MDVTALKDKLIHWIGKYKYIGLVLLVGVGLMLIPGGSDKTETPVQSLPEGVQLPTLSEELEGILSNIKGAGRVQVMLTLKTGEQTVYQMDTPSTDRQDTVIISGEDRVQSGLVQQVISPTYRGAIVLCQGADNASVCLSIKEAVSKVTGLDASQISVLKMK